MRKDHGKRTKGLLLGIYDKCTMFTTGVSRGHVKMEQMTDQKPLKQDEQQTKVCSGFPCFCVQNPSKSTPVSDLRELNTPTSAPRLAHRFGQEQMFLRLKGQKGNT